MSAQTLARISNEDGGTMVGGWNAGSDGGNGAVRATEVAFIDPAVADLDVLIGGLRPEVEPILLNATEPAPRQIARALSAYRDLEAIHVFAHGAPGEVQFASGKLTLEGLDDVTADLAAVGHALEPAGELLLWSCHTGSGTRGAHLLEALEVATGARVAASSRLVGADRRGGSWKLDLYRHHVVAETPLSAEGRRAYVGVMTGRTWRGPGGNQNNPTSGNWNDELNWGGIGNLPDVNDTVTFGGTAGATAYTVTLDVSPTIQAVTFSSATGLATLAVGNQTLVVTNPGAAIDMNLHAALTLAGGTVSLTNATGGITTVAGSTISGAGTVVTAGGAIGGAGAITATGGLLNLNAALTGTTTLTVNGAGDTLKLDKVSAATSVGFNGSTGTLELNTAAALTLTNPLAIAAGTVKLDGGASSLTDLAGISLTSGGKIIGAGVVNGDISGTGAIEATGGVLAVSNNVTSSTILLDVASGSTLALGGTVGTSTSFTYLNNTDFSGTLFLANTTAMVSFESNGVITDMHEATGPGVVATDILDLRPIAFSTNYSTDIAGGNTIQLWDDTAHTTLLASFQLAAPVTAGTHVNWQNDGSNGTSLFLDDDPCYVAGTRILTATGERMVETLVQGDIVLTLAGDELSAQPVKWIGRRRIDLTAHPRPETVAPVRIQRGAFADTMPHSDLLVSPDHAIFVDGKLICARQLINGTTIRQEQGLTSLEYFHVELDAHAILLAEGLPAESYLNTGNHGFFANSGEPLVLHPDLTDESGYPTREAGSCAPFVSDEASVRPVWQHLAERAAVLGQPAPRFDTTTDPGLQLVAKGRKIKPIFANADLAIFVLPRGASEVGLVSRAASPTDVRPWLEDRRRLGVRVARIVLRGADEVREIPVDHPDLGEGWWAIERDGQLMSRWTNGEAVLPLPVKRGDAMLEIHLAGTMTYVVEAAPADEAARRVA